MKLKSTRYSSKLYAFKIERVYVSTPICTNVAKTVVVVGATACDSNLTIHSALNIRVPS